jgi:hypothetical protein
MPKLSSTHHAAHQIGLEPGAFVDVETAKYIDGYKIQIQFSDGHIQIVDFEPFLSQSLHPDVQAYLDVDKFCRFTVAYGNLVWNDYDLLFSVADLYAGVI